ncbi:DUF397 domain-containing protein [Kitasatospora sp. NPDC059648]|uniref:DUF397 domain-containing protein n=1 Tax=Kitasatospora sp. NPDC059648 TaxID=3346894 RepID=UPI0036C6A416
MCTTRTTTALLTPSRFKSPFSGDGNGSCVIIARFDNGDVWLGDDKNPDRPHLAFNQAEWTAFVQAIEARDPRFTA